MQINLPNRVKPKMKKHKLRSVPAQGALKGVKQGLCYSFFFFLYD
jgi:hypothetical protein